MQSYSLTGLPFRWLDRHPRAAEILFDYYARRFRGPTVIFQESLYLRATMTNFRFLVSRLRLALESRNYLEVDLVVARGVDGPYLVDPQTAMR